MNVTSQFSVVSPVYKAEKIVPELVRRIVENISTLSDDYEVILVCDGSPDNSWQAILAECEKNKKVVGINLSRNFGQHYAITAGLSYARGEWVYVMDCDLQDRPEEFANLYKKAQEGYDIVYARRVHRQDKWTKRLSSYMFHSVFDWLSGQKTDDTISNFGIYHHKVISEFVRVPEKARSFMSIISCLGFSSSTVDVAHDKRAEGSSSYNLRKLLKLSMDVIIAQSNKPLRMAVGLGIVMSLVSFLLALYNVFAKLLGVISLQGYTTTVFSIWFVGGILLLVMGVLGLYVGKIFDQVKGRPLFVVREIINREVE